MKPDLGASLDGSKLKGQFILGFFLSGPLFKFLLFCLLISCNRADFDSMSRCGRNPLTVFRQALQRIKPSQYFLIVQFTVLNFQLEI